jgi:transposase
MANRLKMAIVQSILSLHAQGWSARRIAKALEVHRDTVSRYVRAAAPAAPKPANAPILPGRVPDDSKPATAPPDDGNAPIGAGVAPASVGQPLLPEQQPNLANAPIRAAGCGRSSDASPWCEFILDKRGQGLSIKRVWQDLRAQGVEHVSYDSVRRLLKRLGASRPVAPFRRMECAPGEEAQIDFGTGVPITLPDGKRRKTHVFRVVLSHSRKAYSEVCYRQTTEDFLRAIENAFWHFGGVPKTLVIDNLKAAVTHPDWFDPELNPKLLSFCQHYGTVVLPTKPRTPRHKGKIERGIGYVKGNALQGHTFTSLEAQNRHLELWERSVADTRIHGTTKQQVGKLFAEVERAALGPLPGDRFPSFQEARRIVSRDGHVEVAKAYYSVPPEYLGRNVWARWDPRLVRIFNSRLEQIAMHVRQEPGRFSTLGEHLVAEKISGIERGAVWLLSKTQSIGPQAHAWAESMLQTRGIEGLRVLQGLLALANRHTAIEVDQACQTALSYGAFRLRTIRQLLKRRGPTQEPLPFLDEHPIIRPLADYGSWVRAALASHGGRNQQDPQVPSPAPPTSFPSSLFP